MTIKLHLKPLILLVLFASVIGCQSTQQTVQNSSSQRLVDTQECFNFETLSPEDRQVANSILAAGLENEGLFTFIGALKPMSDVTRYRWEVARTDSLSDGYADIVPPDHPDLGSIKQVNRILPHLHCGDVRFVFTPFNRTQGGVRNATLRVVNEQALQDMLTDYLSFWAQWGFAQGADAAVLITVMEHATPSERHRGYGYLYGYPSHAVDFFVESERAFRRTGERAEREFVNIPVFSRPDGRFVYAVPKGAEPTPSEVQLAEEAARILHEFKGAREQYLEQDGTFRAVDFLRDWYTTSYQPVSTF